MKKKINEQELINLAYATYEPYMEIGDELEILMKSDDGGNHLDFFVSNHAAAAYLRENVPHTFEGKRTIIRYRTKSKEEE
jgi:hypothetical protein